MEDDRITIEWLGGPNDGATFTQPAGTRVLTVWTARDGLHYDLPIIVSQDRAYVAYRADVLGPVYGVRAERPR